MSTSSPTNTKCLQTIATALFPDDADAVTKMANGLTMRRGRWRAHAKFGVPLEKCTADQKSELALEMLRQIVSRRMAMAAKPSA